MFIIEYFVISFILCLIEKIISYTCNTYKHYIKLHLVCYQLRDKKLDYNQLWYRY